MAYDPNNVFAKILRGDIPCKKVFEDEHALAFHDIRPQAPVHVLVIPKGAYTDMDDFSARASGEELAGFLRAVGTVAKQCGLALDGYRVISNCKDAGGQDVPHLHFHLIGEKKLGRMLPPS